MFGGTCCLCLQGRRSKMEWQQQAISTKLQDVLFHKLRLHIHHHENLYNLLLIISSSVLWITRCKKTYQMSTRYTQFVYFMVCMVYMKYLLHYLNYSCFLLLITNVGIICNTDFNHSSQKLIHSIPFFNAIFMRQVCTKSLDAANFSCTTKPQWV